MKCLFMPRQVSIMHLAKSAGSSSSFPFPYNCMICLDRFNELLSKLLDLFPCEHAPILHTVISPHQKSVIHSNDQINNFYMGTIKKPFDNKMPQHLSPWENQQQPSSLYTPQFSQMLMKFMEEQATPKRIENLRPITIKKKQYRRKINPYTNTTHKKQPNNNVKELKKTLNVGFGVLKYSTNVTKYSTTLKRVSTTEPSEEVFMKRKKSNSLLKILDINEAIISLEPHERSSLKLKKYKTEEAEDRSMKKYEKKSIIRRRYTCGDFNSRKLN